MTNKSKNSLIAYGCLMIVVLITDVFVAANPEVLTAGPPAWEFAFSWDGTLSIGTLGFIGVLFLNGGSLRGLWDPDLAWQWKTLIPFAIGVLFGLLSLPIRVFTDFDNVLREFVGREDIFLSLGLSIPLYLGGAILIDVFYYLILIPAVVYLVSDRLLDGRRQAIVFWAIATPLALFEPMTNPPPELTANTFGPWIALAILFTGAAFTLTQAWLMFRIGFVALVSARVGLYSVTHILYPQVFASA